MPIEKCLKVAALASAALVAAAAPSRSDDLIKPRLDLLTGLTKDGDSRHVRRFKREDVLSALRALQANLAA